MSEKNVVTSDVEKKALHSLAKAENMPVEVDRRIPGYDMAVMTIIIVIAIICIAVSIVLAFSTPSKGTEASTLKQREIAQVDITKLEFEELPDGVAAIVNGVEIPESAVTTSIESYREAEGLEDDEAWAQHLYEGDAYNDSASARNYILAMKVNQELVAQAAKEAGIEITDEEINELIKQDMEDKGIATEEEYWELLEASGYDKDSFIADNRNQLLQNEIVYLVNPESAYADTLDKRALDYIKQSYPAYKDITSLDEVSESVQNYAREYVVYLLNTEKYNEFMDDFIDRANIKIAVVPSDLSYAADTSKLQLNGFIDQFKRKMEVQSQLGGEEMAPVDDSQDGESTSSEG